jgi:hypothetical protein
MKLKEIRLLDVDIYINDEKIFSGKIEDAYKDYGNFETKEIYFEDGKMQIKL